jgi:hypothetical protein
MRVVCSQTINQVGPGTVLYSNTGRGGRATDRHEFSARVLSRPNNPGVFVGLTNKAWDGSQLKRGVKGEEDEYIILFFNGNQFRKLNLIKTPYNNCTSV